jgi:uncharacterized protein with gpF-like domain
MPKKPPLTPAKRKWAANRDVTLRGTRLAYNASQRIKYQKELQKLINKMAIETKKQLTTLFKGRIAMAFVKQQKEASALDASISSAARILMTKLTDKFQSLFDLVAKPLSETMVDGAARTSKSSLHASLKKLSGGLSLKTGVVPEGMEDIAKALISENVQLIKSIPQKYLDDVAGEVYRSITSGRGLADLVPALNKYEGISLRRAKNIAHDQTRKAYNFINKARMQSIGVKQFKWVHSGGGQSPRESHIKISGTIFSFENLRAEQAKLGVSKKDQGLPGEPINCGCTILPIINFEDE